MLLAGNGEYERPTAASIRARRTLMGHYKSNLRDLEFNLFEVFNRQEILGTGPYADVDQDTAREILHEVGRLAENELAESLLDSDRNTPGFAPRTSSATAQRSDGGTTVPPSSRGTSMRHHSASRYVLYDLMNDAGSFTELVAGSNTGGLRSESSRLSASSFSARRPTSCRISRAVSWSTSA